MKPRCEPGLKKGKNMDVEKYWAIWCPKVNLYGSHFIWGGGMKGIRLFSSEDEAKEYKERNHGQAQLLDWKTKGVMP